MVWDLVPTLYSVNALSVGWGYDNKGRLMLLVPTFHYDKNFNEIITSDDEVKKYLNRVYAFAIEHIDENMSYEEFVKRGFWKYDFDLYELKDGRLVDTLDGIRCNFDTEDYHNGDVLDMSNEPEKYFDIKLELTAGDYHKIMPILLNTMTLDSKLDDELKVGDVRYNAEKEEIVIIIPANHCFYGDGDEANSLVIIMSFSNKKLVSFTDFGGNNKIVLDLEMLKDANLKSAYPYLITRNLSDLIE